jgi:hypothetical protein
VQLQKSPPKEIEPPSVILVFSQADMEEERTKSTELLAQAGEREMLLCKQLEQLKSGE